MSRPLSERELETRITEELKRIGFPHISVTMSAANPRNVWLEDDRNNSDFFNGDRLLLSLEKIKTPSRLRRLLPHRDCLRTLVTLMEKPHKSDKLYL